MGDNSVGRGNSVGGSNPPLPYRGISPFLSYWCFGVGIGRRVSKGNRGVKNLSMAKR